MSEAHSNDRNAAVGYCKPPMHSRFTKGRSGNPGGRPRGMTAARANRLALKEAYRLVTIREGGKTLKMPAIQAVMRNQVALAAKGNGPAQRALIEMVRDIEREVAAQEQVEWQAKKAQISPIEAARRIAYALHLASRKLEEEKSKSAA